MAAFDIQKFVDERKISRIHLIVLVLCSLVMFIDGLDVFMVGKIAPAIARGFGETRAAMTQVFTFQQIGLAIGAFLAAPLADRFGRRVTLIVSAAMFGLLTVAAVFSQSLLQLAIVRGLAGLFLSGVLPMAIALVSEFTPKSSRGTFIAIAMGVYTVGGAAGGAIAAWLIDDYGWQIGFWIGGLIPLACVPLMLMLLPESLQLLAGRDPKHPSIAAALRRIDRGVALTGDETFLAGDGSRSRDKASLLEIFQDGRARTTIIIWLCCVGSMGNIALLASWMPSFFEQMAGIPIQRFAVTAMIAFAGGLTGTLTMGWLMDRIRPTLLIPVYFVGNAISLVVLSLLPFGTLGFMAALTAWNLFQSGGQAGLNTLIAHLYPASTRSTALGWAGGAGRVAGVFTPLFGGYALASSMSLQATLTIIAVPPIAVALLLLYLGARAPKPLPPVAAGLV